MISVDEALLKLTSNVSAVCATEKVSLSECLGRVLAEPVISPVNVPPKDNSAMDGYAVHSSEISPDKPFEISQRITAGSSPTPLTSGTIARIFTGAEIPESADAVIIQENSEQQGNEVRFTCGAEPGENIRRQGQDLKKNTEVLKSGKRLRPQEVGLIASCGIKEISAYKKLRVALISTGDELLEPGQAEEPGKIYNSNRYLLNSLCLSAGFDPIDRGRVADNFDDTVRALSEAAKTADVILTTGGVSVGEEDHVKPAIEKLGALDLWKVAIKPGKPLALGKIGNSDVIGLPGNPSSVFTTFLILCLPRLRLLQGHDLQNLITEKQTALFERKSVRRQEYLRARKTASGVEIFPNQSSGVLSSACWGDGFVIQPAGCEIKEGQKIDFLSYSNLI